MDQREVLKKIYQGGLQDHIPQDEVKIFANNLRNDCFNYCIKDFLQKKLTQSEKECTKNFMAKNIHILNLNLNRN